MNVLEKVVLVSDIALNKTILSMKKGEEFTLVPTVTPDNAADRSVRWSSDNEAVVTVSDEGHIRNVSANYSRSCYVLKMDISGYLAGTSCI